MQETILIIRDREGFTLLGLIDDDGKARKSYRI